MNPDILRLILPYENTRLLKPAADNDFLLILMLIFLFMSEKNDFILTFSLLYILM